MFWLLAETPYFIVGRRMRMNNSTTMKQLFTRFDNATNDIESLKFIIDSVKRNGDLESKSFTATNSNPIAGELYTLQSVGVYTITSTGSGRSSYVIKDPKTLDVIYQGTLSDGETKEVYLTYGDLFYGSVSALSSSPTTLEVNQTKSLFSLMSGKMDDVNIKIEYFNARINELLDSLNNNAYPSLEVVGSKLVINQLNDYYNVKDTTLFL